MQCPIYSCCMSSRFAFLAISCLGIGVGVLSVFSPKRSIGLYQWIMERFNWKVSPIDESREIRSTRFLGIILTLLSVAVLTIIFFKS